MDSRKIFGQLWCRRLRPTHGLALNATRIFQGFAVNSADRLLEILRLLQVTRSCSIGELARRFDVSEETIRRDVRQLEQAGRVSKFHGGVRLPEALIEPPHQVRLQEEADAKRLIGEAAAGLVEDGMTILFDCSTSAHWMARALSRPRSLSIVTNGFEVAGEILNRDNYRLFLAGGRVDVDYRACFGPDAIAYARRFTPDIMFVSTGALDARRGFMDFSSDEADFKRALFDRARRVVVLCTSNKFGKAGVMHFADFSEVHDLITDAAPPSDLKAALDAASVRTLVAGPA